MKRSDPEYMAVYTQESFKKGMCRSHPNVPVVFNRTLCKDCLYNARKRRKENINKARCQNHPESPVVFGKKHCQNCLDKMKIRHQNRIDGGICVHHVSAPAVIGKKHCQICLDNRAVYLLPKSVQPDALKRAIETREARMSGTYVCPVLGKTEKELNDLFLSKSNRSVWAFDHKGDKFRNIISRRANHAIGTLTSEQLFQGANYVSKYEI